MSTRIDIARLQEVTETAASLKAQWRAQYDLARDAADTLAAARRERSTTLMNWGLHHPDSDIGAQLHEQQADRLRALDDKIAALRSQAHMRDLEAKRLSEHATTAGRLAQACVDFAKSAGVVLPTADRHATEFIGQPLNGVRT